MGLFGPAHTYSTHEHTLHTEEIKAILENHFSYLKPEHRIIVTEAIREKRGSDKQISLEQIHQVLISIEQRQVVDHPTREEIMKLFVAHYAQHFK